MRSPNTKTDQRRNDALNLFTTLVMAMFILIALEMRGDAFHQFLAERASFDLWNAGFTVLQEHPIRLADGRLNFIDLFCTRGDVTLACEIETTVRYVSINAEKARMLDVPLWVIVPTQRLKQAARRKVERTVNRHVECSIQFLLLDELPQALTKCFPTFSDGECHHGKHGKTEKRKSSDRYPT